MLEFSPPPAFVDAQKLISGFGSPVDSTGVRRPDLLVDVRGGGPPEATFTQVFILRNLHGTFAQLLILLTFAHATLRIREKRGVPPPGFFAGVHFAHVSLRRIGPGADAKGAVFLVHLMAGEDKPWARSSGWRPGAQAEDWTRHPGTGIRRAPGGLSSGRWSRRKIARENGEK